nr:MAG TPA: hypothetical protein [Caudoviricetes sp.]
MIIDFIGITFSTKIRGKHCVTKNFPHLYEKIRNRVEPSACGDLRKRYANWFFNGL